MRKLRDIPIRQKLMIIIMIITTVALLLAAVGVVVADSFLFRSYLQRDLSTLARIISDNSTAALAFNDPQSAGETLAALRARSHLVSACVYRLDGTVLAKYARPGAAACPPIGGEEDLRFERAGLTVSHAIVLRGRRIGTLTILYDLGEIPERIRLYGVTVLGVFLFSSMIAFMLSSRLRAVVAYPISQLVSATTSVAETGDYSIRAKKLSGDELGALADRFNEMLATIQSRDKDLRTVLHERGEALEEAERAREKFRFMAESMPQKIFTTNPDGEVDYFNQQWLEFAGLTFEQTKREWRNLIHPDDRAENGRAWRESLKTGQPFQIQRRFRRFDGLYRWHLSRVRGMRGLDGNISMWIGSDTDIHEQKEKEDELRRANEDLQQFAYSASHDLQEPIRNVTIYSEIIAERYRHLLDSDGQQFLGFLTEGGRRLATLIHDLLAYTRAGVFEGELTTVNASEVLQHALASLAEAARESKAIVTCDALPEVVIAEIHLQQLFQNLIGNALKYRKDSPPRIHVSASRQDGNWRFSVQDDGIGIDPQYKEKIFGVFKRLHRDQKFSGTGIGLAICQRVVERYGGRIWVESALGEGATFYFTVPQIAAEDRPATIESSAG